MTLLFLLYFNLLFWFLFNSLGFDMLSNPFLLLLRRVLLYLLCIYVKIIGVVALPLYFLIFLDRLLWCHWLSSLLLKLRFSWLYLFNWLLSFNNMELIVQEIGVPFYFLKTRLILIKFELIPGFRVLLNLFCISLLLIL